jgi:hypothetical protein
MVCNTPIPNGLGHTNRTALTDSNRNGHCAPAQHSARRTDGSIDFDFYRAIATEERRSAINQAITVLWNRRWQIFRTPRLVLPAVCPRIRFTHRWCLDAIEVGSRPARMATGGRRSVRQYTNSGHGRFA